MILKFVNHAHTHNHSHVYSHEVTMKVITGVGVALCGFVILAFIFWLVVRYWHHQRSVNNPSVQFGLSYLN